MIFLILLAELESNKILANNISLQRYYSLSRVREPILKEYIEKDRGIDSFTYSSDQIRNLILLFQSQRSKKIEGFVVILSAILGGVVGALLTILSI